MNTNSHEYPFKQFDENWGTTLPCLGIYIIFYFWLVYFFYFSLHVGLVEALSVWSFFVCSNDSIDILNAIVKSKKNVLLSLNWLR
jgi:hypothetical protein